MNTISGNNSLILSEHTINRSNIFGIDRLFFKDNYFNVFNSIANKFSSGKVYGKFTAVWHEVCMAECNAVKNKVAEYIKQLNQDKLDKADEELVNRVVVKFRGNLGEIFAEAFIREGYMSKLCKASVYNTVDPNNEEYVDAESISASDGLPVGIQIKNYNKFALDSIDTCSIFNKASVSALRQIHQLKSIEDTQMYLKQPHQIIFSFTELGSDFIVERYLKDVIFFGPKDIDSVYLQGNIKKNINANWLFFKTVADEIKAFTV